MFDIDAERGSFLTSDGVRISYLEAGSGPPFVMVPGWSQTAAQWHHQINHFAKTHHVFALDLRGHGDSEKPDHGYRVTRLAKDLRDFIEHRDLRDITLMGHSMGCSVIYALYDLYGADRLSRLIIVDQSPYLSDNPTLTATEKAEAGALFTPQACYEVCQALNGPDAVATTRQFVGGMFTSRFVGAELEAVIALNLQMPRHHSATLIADHVHNDWRDVVRRIAVPVLAIGGKASLVPWSCIIWTANSVAGPGQSVIFEEPEGGAHFMFMENPSKFNDVVAGFLNGPPY